MNLHFLTIYLIFQLAASQNPSPCPKVFKYEKKADEIDRWYGIIEIRPDKYIKGLSFQIVLDRPADLLATWLGSVTTKDNTAFTIRKEDFSTEAGSVISVKILVKYSLAQNVPSVKSIQFEGQSICPENQSPPTHLHDDTVKSTRADRLVESDTENKPKDDSVFKGDFGWLSTQEGLSSSPLQVNVKSIGCGMARPKANALIVNGHETFQGQWPWHVALYHTVELKLEYFCGGTLISERHVLTAAHCVTLLRSKTLVNPESLLVSLGRHSLHKLGEHLQDRTVSRIFVHSEYNPDVLFNDIAILKLSRPVEITDSVHPCCLWEGDKTLTNLIGKEGTVVGWGFTKQKSLSDKLMQANMPIVSTDDCLYSLRSFFSQFKHAKNYCAGYLNGTSVCIGDSGGGMVFPKKDSPDRDTTWQIRGIVSVGVALQNGNKGCDTSHYALFTDVAMFTPWIQEILAQ